MCVCVYNKNRHEERLTELETAVAVTLERERDVHKVRRKRKLWGLNGAMNRSAVETKRSYPKQIKKSSEELITKLQL